MPRHQPTLPAALVTALGLRVPVFEKDASPSYKIAELESYLLLSAFTQGELTEQRLDWLVRLVPLEDEWDHLAGWEEHLRTRTEKGVTQAKRCVRPDLYDEIQDIEWMVKRLSEEIDRMERDATKCSRAYSMITGS